MGPLNDPLLSRRGLLKLGALSSLSWWLGGDPARAQEPDPAGVRERGALIVLWLDGGPSQLETFDPKPGTKIGGPTRAIATSLPGVQFGADYPRLAERARRLAVIRSLTTRDGEHVRARYLLRTGANLIPTVTYPTVSAVIAHELETRGLEIPRHVAIGAEEAPQGGFLGKEFNAFAIKDPQDPLPDLVSPAGDTRFAKRLDDLAELDGAFARGRSARVQGTQHGRLAQRARRMMGSAQLKAFDYRQESEATIAAYGDSAFGRGCLVARRLVEIGVPAVEVTLRGWDTHISNFENHTKLAGPLDQGFAALLDDLAERELLDHTVVLCCGEFGRTPRVNGLEGRDHWTKGFSALLAGRGLRPGVLIGETDPEGERGPSDPVVPRDLFATLYEALGVDRTRLFETAAGRPIQLNEGTPLRALLA